MLRRLALAVVPVVLVLAAGCGSDKKAAETTTAPISAAAPTTAAAATTAAGAATTAAPGGGGSTITVADFVFSPPTLTVKAGTAVDIKNTQGVAHTFTADDGSFDLELDPNGGGTHTFATAGSFPYHCTIHTSMKGTVVVEG